MEAHAVPQNVTAFEFHLIGNMTMRQFGYLMIGVVISYITFLLFGTTVPFVAWPIIIISCSIGAAYAFLPIMERPLDYWTKAFIKAVGKPTLRKYKSLRFPKDDANFQNRLNIYFQYLQAQAYREPEMPLVLPIPNRKDYSEPVILPNAQPVPPPNLPQNAPRPQTQPTPPVAATPPPVQPMQPPPPPAATPIQTFQQSIPQPFMVTPPPPKPVQTFQQTMPPVQIPKPAPVQAPTPRPVPIAPTPAPVPPPMQTTVQAPTTQPVIPPPPSPVPTDQISQFLDKLGKLKTQQVKVPVPQPVPQPIPTPKQVTPEEIAKIVEGILKKQQQSNTDDLKKIAEDVIAEKQKAEPPVNPTPIIMPTSNVVLQTNQPQSEESETTPLNDKKFSLTPDSAEASTTNVILNNPTIQPVIAMTGNGQETQKILQLLESKQTPTQSNLKTPNAPAKSGPLIIMPVQMEGEIIPTNEDLSQTVTLAKEAQTIQEQIHQTEKQINWIRSNNKSSDEFQSSLVKLQQLHQKEHDVTKKLALITKTPTVGNGKPVTKPSIIPTLTLTQTGNIINGIVTDSQGSYIDGAIIVAHDSQGMPVRALKTNKLGQFIAATPLRDGKYTITIEKEELQFDSVEVDLHGAILNPVVVSAKKGGLQNG